MSSEEDEPPMSAFLGSRHNGGRSTEETINLSMNAKLPPSYDGRVSWFRYEDLVRDWCTFTVIEPERRGPLLKNRLIDEAMCYRELLDNEKLVDGDTGVDYFLNFLRGYFLKGVQNVFLYRFLSFFNHRRGNGEFITFISKFEILLRRLRASWEDTAPEFTINSPEYIQAITDANAQRRDQHNRRVSEITQLMMGLPQQAAAPIVPDPVYLDSTDQVNFDRFVQNKRKEHTNAFPLSDNMLTLFFIIQSELSEGQRERLVSSLSLRGIQLPQFTYELVKAQYYDLFITTRTNLQDPNIRPSGGSRSKTFFILEQGDYEGEEGFWVEDEEGAEGFCPLDDEEAFWQLEDNDAFVLRRVPRRTLKSGKGRKGRKGKGKRRRGSFRPYRKAQTGGKANMAEDSTTDHSYWGKKGKPQPWFQKGKGKPFSKTKDKGKDPGKDDKGKGKTKTFAVDHNAEAQDATQQPGDISAEPYQDDWGQSAWWSSEWNNISYYSTRHPKWLDLRHHTACDSRSSSSFGQ